MEYPDVRGVLSLTPTSAKSATAQTGNGAPTAIRGTPQAETTPISNAPASSLGTFTFPTRILFGNGARTSLGAELARLGIKRPLVVIDAGVLAAGLVREVIPPPQITSVFESEVHSNPTEDDVLAGLDRYRTGDCDGLIGLGGGSPIDAAKAIRLLVSHPGRLADYEITRVGQDRICSSMPPMVAIPTTAGTGSEVGRAALIQLPQSGRKSAILSQYLFLASPFVTRN